MKPDLRLDMWAGAYGRPIALAVAALAVLCLLRGGYLVAEYTRKVS